jgi:hypothetical protein
MQAIFTKGIRDRDGRDKTRMRVPGAAVRNPNLNWKYWYIPKRLSLGSIYAARAGYYILVITYSLLFATKQAKERAIMGERPIQGFKAGEE